MRRRRERFFRGVYVSELLWMRRTVAPGPARQLKRRLIARMLLGRGGAESRS